MIWVTGTKDIFTVDDMATMDRPSEKKKKKKDKADHG